jgi:glycosyltransferase involved in cell wall biosynthesis
LQLILLTSSYPYDFSAEYTFIDPEIGFLAEKFSKVILVPRATGGCRRPLPPNVDVEDTYSGFLQNSLDLRKMIHTVFSSHLMREELRNRPDILLYPSKILKLVLFASRVELTAKWTAELIKSRQMDPRQSLLYSYWMDHAATGLAMVKRSSPALKVISRAHNFDIFEKYYYPYYWPYRKETLEILDHLFLISDSGKKHFSDHYPKFKPKYEIARLGVNDPRFICKPSDDSVFRIISCSYIVPAKRLNLLLDAIASAARRRPEQKFEWVHIGDGKGRKSLARRMARHLPSNVKARLIGHISNHEVMQFYRDQPVDVFVNVSKSEGIPVSIMEAISCGIPIIATYIGGNSEIVSDENGILISADPTPDEIADAFFYLIDHPNKTVEKREAGRRIWYENYNAEVNFRAFAERLQSIGEH